MKVAVVSTPRTCSSMLGHVFAKKFDLIDYSEMFSEMWVKADPQTKLKMLVRGDNFSLKITSTSLTTTPNISLETFPWHIFDYIIVTERLDIAQQAASWLLLSEAQTLGKGEQGLLVEYLREGMKNPETFPEVNRGQLKTIIETINHFHEQVKPFLLTSGLKSVKLVNHEMFQKSREEYVEEFREKTDVYWKIDDLDGEGNPTYVDYTPYIESHNIRQIIDEIQNEIKETNATEEEIRHEYEGPDPTEGQGIV